MENSIEEDIKILEKKINDWEPYKNINFHTSIEKEISIENEAIEHILSDYKRVLKENEELKREIERQKDINTIINEKGLDRNYEKALEKTMTKFLNDNINNDFITIQKVKDKVEKLEAQYKIALEENSTKAFILKCQITILQELLEKEK